MHLQVIVPYRPNKHQNREAQLQKFLEYMWVSETAFLKRLTAFESIVLLVVQQTKDGRKFNRGAVLNTGVRLGETTDTTSERVTVMFHDVDLLPLPDLLPWYDRTPGAWEVLHPAGAWGKYPFPRYLGGVVAMRRSLFEACNGFPNTFWGWGGEDDALLRRLETCTAGRVRIVRPKTPPPPAFLDLESEPGAGIRASTRIADGGLPELRNMSKREQLRADDDGWTTDGLNTVQYIVRTTTTYGCEVDLLDVYA